MISYIIMKVFESAPQRYDWGLHVISLGHINKIRWHIVNNFIDPGNRVLDIGCGTGTLAVMMAIKGARVDGFDLSKNMLAVAKQKVNSAGMERNITLITLDVADMESALRDKSYDRIVSNLVFSELSEDEQIYVLQESKRLLKDQGLLIIGDEIIPQSSFCRWIFRTMRFPLAVLTFLLTQSTTRSVKDLKDKIIKTGFQIVSADQSLLGSFELIAAVKKETDL